jgi:hypothetical protein
MTKPAGGSMRDADTEAPRMELYRQRAAEAEDQANTIDSESIRDAWLSIARCYRRMADQEREKDDHGHSMS